MPALGKDRFIPKKEDVHVITLTDEYVHVYPHYKSAILISWERSKWSKSRQDQNEFGPFLKYFLQPNSLMRRIRPRRFKND